MNDFSPEILFSFVNYVHAPLFDDCEYAWDALPLIGKYLSTLKLGRIDSEIPESSILVNRNQITIEKGCTIEPGVYIKGPCYIGRGSEVRFGAYIRGNFIAGTDCVIGHGTEIKNSIFFNRTHAAHFAYVGDSILGSDVNLGAGTKLANLKLRRDEVWVKHKGSELKTGLRKFGAILGDGAQTGCNSVTNPGTVMGVGAASYPCANISGFVPAKHLFNHERNLIPIRDNHTGKLEV